MSTLEHWADALCAELSLDPEDASQKTAKLQRSRGIRLKPIGTGVLNASCKATGEVSAAAIEVMTTLNADAADRRLASGSRARPT